jgi:ubiquinone/menaquinone biosynthesis C-methylase UbiE
MYPSANLFACDISPKMIDEAKENYKGIDVKFSIQNAQNLLEYKDAQFDLHHISSKQFSWSFFYK